MDKQALKQHKITTEPVHKLVIEYAIPSIVCMLISSLYNLVDTMFVGRLDTQSTAAIGIVFPYMALIQSFSFFFGHGSGNYISRALGARQTDDAKNMAASGFFCALFLSIAVSLVSLLFSTPVLKALGSTDTILPAAIGYFRYILLGTPFISLCFVLNNQMRHQGNAMLSMYGIMSGTILNIILDPIFIFVFKWGMMGAAVATVLGQVLTAILAIWYLLNMKLVKPSAQDFRLHGGTCKRTLILGLTSFLSQISLVAAMAAINNMIRKYGAMDAVFGQEQYAQIPMAVVGIVMKFFQIVISIVVGMAAGCIPIVGFNMGAGKKERVRELFTKLLTAEAAVGAIALLIVECFPRQLIGIFGASNESVYYTEFAIRAFRIYLCMMIFACVNKACFIFLQAMGKAAASTFLSMVREIVFGVGFALLLPIFWGLDGVLYSMPLSDILTFVIAIFLIIGTYKELKEEPKV